MNIYLGFSDCLNIMPFYVGHVVIGETRSESISHNNTISLDGDIAIRGTLVVHAYNIFLWIWIEMEWNNLWTRS